MALVLEEPAVATSANTDLPGGHELTDVEARSLFDREARETLGMTG